MSTKTYTSPDGLLRLKVIADVSDVSVGFEGFSWHTHADILAAICKLPEADAVNQFVNAILHDKSVVAVSRRGAQITDIWISDDPGTELRRTLPGEVTELRYWNGTSWKP